MDWKTFPEHAPPEPGYYYYTCHFYKGQLYYKAFVWGSPLVVDVTHGGLTFRRQDITRTAWCWDGFRVPVVLAFLEESKNPYYVPCEESVTDEVFTIFEPAPGQLEELLRKYEMSLRYSIAV